MSNHDPYSYPGLDVLLNKANIQDDGKLSQFEFRKSAERALELSESPIKGHYDLDHLKAIHKHLFQDVYEWAGEIRNVDISKGKSHFAPRTHIESYANSSVFKDLANDNHLRGMGKEQFIERLAHHYAEINALHPFREGNGRSTRIFIQQLARDASYDIDYTKIDAQRWNEAARLSFSTSIEPMKEVFRDISTPLKEQDMHAEQTLPQNAERLVVSNGSRRIERHNEGEWLAASVGDKGNLRNGVYPLHEAKQVKQDEKIAYAGTIIHADKKNVYQDLGDNKLVRHNRSAFDVVPPIGQYSEIKYDQGRAAHDYVAPARAVSFDKDKPQDAINKHPELRTAYDALNAAESYATKLKPAARDAFIDVAKEKIRATLYAGKLVPELADKSRSQSVSTETQRQAKSIDQDRGR